MPLPRKMLQERCPLNGKLVALQEGHLLLNLDHLVSAEIVDERLLLYTADPGGEPVVVESQDEVKALWEYLQCASFCVTHLCEG